MMQLENISYHTPHFSLNNLSFTFNDQQIHAIVGPSGSGKTTLLDIIAGLKSPTSGKIFLNKTDITTLKPEHRQIGYLPQDHVLFPHLNVKNNILYPLLLKHQKNDKALIEISEKLQIAHLLNRNIQHLSGGEAQRVALARCLIAGYKTLLLDEPASAYHPSLKTELYYFLKDTMSFFHLNILLVTHDVHNIFSIADNLLFLINGTLYQTHSNTQKFIPAHIEIACFMGIRNLFEGTFLPPHNIICPSLNKTLQGPLQLSKNRASSQKIYWGITSEDVRIIIPERKEMYKDAPNKMKGSIKKIYKDRYFYTIYFVPADTQQYLEILYPVTKSEKIDLHENAEIEIFLKPEDIFLLNSAG